MKGKQKKWLWMLPCAAVIAIVAGCATQSLEQQAKTATDVSLDAVFAGETGFAYWQASQEAKNEGLKLSDPVGYSNGVVKLKARRAAFESTMNTFRQTYTTANEGVRVLKGLAGTNAVSEADLKAFEASVQVTANNVLSFFALTNSPNQ